MNRILSKYILLIIVFWNGETPGANSHWDFSSVKGFFIVDDVEYSSKTADNLEVKKNELNDRQNEKREVCNELEIEISNTRNQKDVIKNSLIEQELGRTEDGKALLEKLNGTLGMGLLGE